MDLIPTKLIIFNPQEDELKLNNVFYKLGRHDTDIRKSNDMQISIRKSTQQLEAKLNKQSFNVRKLDDI